MEAVGKSLRRYLGHLFQHKEVFLASRSSGYLMLKNMPALLNVVRKGTTPWPRVLRVLLWVLQRATSVFVVDFGRVLQVLPPKGRGGLPVRKEGEFTSRLRKHLNRLMVRTGLSSLVNKFPSGRTIFKGNIRNPYRGLTNSRENVNHSMSGFQSVRGLGYTTTREYTNYGFAPVKGERHHFKEPNLGLPFSRTSWLNRNGIFFHKVVQCVIRAPMDRLGFTGLTYSVRRDFVGSATVRVKPRRTRVRRRRNCVHKGTRLTHFRGIVPMPWLLVGPPLNPVRLRPLRLTLFVSGPMRIVWPPRTIKGLFFRGLCVVVRCT